MHKLIFLDIDGVLNSTRSVQVKIGVSHASERQQLAALQLIETVDIPYGAQYALKCVDPVCTALVNNLLENTGAGLVLSSTHRKHFANVATGGYGNKHHLELLKLYLTAMGIHVPEMFSVTPSLNTSRGKEVAEWINLAYENGVDVDSYVILDDGADFDSDQPLVLCDANEGLSFANYVEAYKLLGGNPSPILI